jgi:pimeloyl-ACP methyl ester carboxylesterase
MESHRPSRALRDATKQQCDLSACRQGLVVRDAQMSFEERFEFSGHQGQRLVGRVSHASGFDAVVLVHAPGSNMNAQGVYANAAQALRRLGWSSLRFDLTGDGESRMRAGGCGLPTRDVASAVELMRAIGYRRIALWGRGDAARVCLDAAVQVHCRVLMDDAIQDTPCAPSTPRRRPVLAGDFASRLTAPPLPRVDRSSLLILDEKSAPAPDTQPWPCVRLVPDLKAAVDAGAEWIAGRRAPQSQPA